MFLGSGVELKPKYVRPVWTLGISRAQAVGMVAREIERSNISALQVLLLGYLCLAQMSLRAWFPSLCLISRASQAVLECPLGRNSQSSYRNWPATHVVAWLPFSALQPGACTPPEPSPNFPHLLVPLAPPTNEKGLIFLCWCSGPVHPISAPNLTTTEDSTL